MAKLKQGNKASTVATAPQAPEAAPGGWWPKEFLAPRPSAIIVAAGIFATLVIGMLALNNGLLGVKQVLAYLLGLTNPFDIGIAPTSLDAGAVLIGFIWVLIGAAIHPALGIAVLALLRPWLDGYTFPTDNMYFVWGTVLCFMIWGVGKVMRGGEVRAWRAALFFAAFPLVAFILSSQSINYNETFRALVIWPSYVILFFLVANMATNPAIFRLLVGVIAISIVAEAIFAVMQYRYILPYLREVIQRDPRVLQSVFGVENPTAELARRFNINRAFGTVLFPNALAAFLITWIPLLAVASWNNLQAWRAMGAAKRVATAADRRAALYLSVATWALGMMVIYGLFQFPMMYVDAARLPWYIGATTSAWVAIALAFLPAAGLFMLTLRRGASGALTIARTSLYALGLLISCYALALTFSRGGYLGLLVGGGLGAALLIVAPGRILPRVPNALKRMGGVVAVCFVGMMLVAQAPSSNTTEIGVAASLPSTTITTQGQDVSAADLASGASFKARFTYWRVGLSMFLDNPWTGVGLRGFGWAYPKYQYLGAHDVREAHNAILQSYCETGIVGGTVLVLFWAGVLILGVLWTLAEQDKAKKRVLAALTAGLAAFLFHSTLDINFSHPTLMFFASAAAGLLFALAPAPGPSRMAHLSVLPALVLAALCAGVGMRVFTQDLALGRVSLLGVSDDKELKMRVSVGQHFMMTIPEYMGMKKQIPGIYLASAGTLIPDLQVLTAQGIVVTRGADGKHRRLVAGEPIPPDALLQVTKPWDARRLAIDGAVKTVAEAEAIDVRFPYNPMVATYISQWYEMLVAATDTQRLKPQQPKFIERMIYWAQEATRRNPWHADLKAAEGRSYWIAAAYQKTDNRELYEKAWSCMKQAVMLSQATADYWGLLYGAGIELAKSYEKAGLVEKAAEFRKLAEEAQAQNILIVTRRGELGI